MGLGTLPFPRQRLPAATRLAGPPVVQKDRLALNDRAVQRMAVRPQALRGRGTLQHRVIGANDDARQWHLPQQAARPAPRQAQTTPPGNLVAAAEAVRALVQGEVGACRLGSHAALQQGVCQVHHPVCGRWRAGLGSGGCDGGRCGIGVQHRLGARGLEARARGAVGQALIPHGSVTTGGVGNHQHSGVGWIPTPGATLSRPLLLNPRGSDALSVHRLKQVRVERPACVHFCVAVAHQGG